MVVIWACVDLPCFEVIGFGCSHVELAAKQKHVSLQHRPDTQPSEQKDLCAARPIVKEAVLTAGL